MSNLKSLKLRIKSVKATQKITKAMKMVAASKLRKVREQAEAADVYSSRMRKVVASLANSGTDADIPLLAGSGKEETYLIIVATSDRGLCGSFNSSIVKAAKKKIANLLAEGKKVKILCVGKKGYDLLKVVYQKNIVKKLEEVGKKSLSYTDADNISKFVLEYFGKEEFDVCIVFYNKFQSAISQIVTEQQIIPLQIDKDNSEGNENLRTLYEYEPNENKILANLLPKNVTVQIFNALLENAASEQGARMTAMDNSTRNAGEMIKKLTLVYNRTRQAAITKELIEIISGAEAL